MEGNGVPGFLLWPTILLEIIFPIFVIIGYKTQISANISTFLYYTTPNFSFRFF